MKQSVPVKTADTVPFDQLSPREIVEVLNRYVIGQRDAKRMVAIALRNRWRRQQLSPELRDEIFPKNIIMIGPTGVGKTEISRRLAKLADAPFIKVEASKFTEVGYVGRDVESIIRDLTEQSVTMVKGASLKRVERKAEDLAEDRVLDLLLPRSQPRTGFDGQDAEAAAIPRESRGTAPGRNSANNSGKANSMLEPWKSKSKNGTCRWASSPTWAAWKNSKTVSVKCWGLALREEKKPRHENSRCHEVFYAGRSPETH